MKLGNVKTKTFSAASAAALDTAIAAWLVTDAKEKTFVNSHFDFDGATYTAMLVYAD